jgi:hypothetical protein
VVRVTHGPGVEVTDGWVCEAVWDGDFAAGGFDRTEIVAGSGVRLRDGEVTFVSSCSTVDRLQTISRLGTLWVSNSLPGLFRAAGTAPDTTYPDYYWDFRSIVDGLSRYKRPLPTLAEPVELVYFDNLVWDGQAVRRSRKPESAPLFAGFTGYRRFLSSSLRGIVANMGDATRREPFTMLSTASAGYDSPTVSVLAAELGCREALSFDRGRDGGDDSGEAVAEALGMRTIRVARDAWQGRALPEVPFIAANAYGEEVHYGGAEGHLARRVLLTGYHGDKMWAKDTDDLHGDIRRGDPSGLGLTEYRLRAGFIHCPVPFWSARRAREVVAISNSPEMRPWDVSGDYSRPICRRIVEEAGVPRESFGVAKRATSFVLHNQKRFLTEASTERYLGWLREHRRVWVQRRRAPPLLNPRLDRAMARGSLVIGSPQLRPLRRIGAYADLERRLARPRVGPNGSRRFVFQWAVAEAKSVYEAAVPG